jgi:hypothetical protein
VTLKQRPVCVLILQHMCHNNISESYVCPHARREDTHRTQIYYYRREDTDHVAGSGLPVIQVRYSGDPSKVHCTVSGVPAWALRNTNAAGTNSCNIRAL